MIKSNFGLILQTLILISKMQDLSSINNKIAGVTKIRHDPLGKDCAKIIGYDANALYLGMWYDINLNHVQFVIL